jgi:hypothetical protein
MKPEFSDKALYEQLKFLESLVDVRRAEGKLKDLNRNRLAHAGGPLPAVQYQHALPQSHRLVLDELFGTVSKVVNSSAYNWVRPSLWSAVFKNVKKERGERAVKAEEEDAAMKVEEPASAAPTTPQVMKLEIGHAAVPVQ